MYVEVEAFALLTHCFEVEVGVVLTLILKKLPRENQHRQVGTSPGRAGIQKSMPFRVQQSFIQRRSWFKINISLTKKAT